MSVKELEKAVSELQPADFKEFRRWVADYDMELWDKQIESDSASGRLDRLLEQAMADYRAGKASDI